MNKSCTSKEFKKDISELCDKCPLTMLINIALKEQIEVQAEENSKILSKTQFNEYVYSEIENAKSAMQRVYLTELQNKEYKQDPYRSKRIELYIWNKERIRVLNTFLKLDEPKTKSSLSLSQIALIHAYNEDYITRDNGNEIAEKYGHKSGEKLYQKFLEYHSSSERKGDTGSKIKNKNKIKLIKSVIIHLPNNLKDRARDEVLSLELIQEKGYQ